MRPTTDADPPSEAAEESRRSGVVATSDGRTTTRCFDELTEEEQHTVATWIGGLVRRDTSVDALTPWEDRGAGEPNLGALGRDRDALRALADLLEDIGATNVA